MIHDSASTPILEIPPFALTKPVALVQATATRPFVREVHSVLTRNQATLESPKGTIILRFHCHAINTATKKYI